MYVQREVISSMVKRIQREVTLSILQKDKHKFSNGKVQADCVLCCIGDEDIVHMLTQCSALHEIRREQMQILKKSVVEYTCKTTWKSHFNNPESITQLILDCTLFRTLFNSSSQLDDIMRKTTDLCCKLHVHRLCLLDDVTTAWNDLVLNYCINQHMHVLYK